MKTPGPQNPGANVSEIDRRSRYFFLAAFFLAAGFFAAFFFAAMMVYLLTLLGPKNGLAGPDALLLKSSRLAFSRRLCAGNHELHHLSVRFNSPCVPMMSMGFA